MQSAPDVVAWPQTTNEHAGLPQSTITCCCHALQAVKTTDQFTAGVQPELVALNVTFPAPHDSMEAA